MVARSVRALGSSPASVEIALEERDRLLVVVLVVEDVGLAADRLAVVRVAREHVLEGASAFGW